MIVYLLGIRSQTNWNELCYKMMVYRKLFYTLIRKIIDHEDSKNYLLAPNAIPPPIPAPR